MDIKQVLKDYDALFRKSSPEEIHAFLRDRIAEAEAEGDNRALLTLLNEQIGYARDTDRREVVFSSGKRLQTLLREMHLEGSLPYGNSLLNIATAFRAHGRYEESAELYPEIEKTFRGVLEEDAYEFAGLYNNWSLLYLDLHQPEKAVPLIREAVRVTDLYERAVIRQATSRTNLASALMELSVTSEPEQAAQYREEARAALTEAAERFEAKGGDDYHYAAALSGLAELQAAEGSYAEAADNYQRAMKIVRLYMGENQNYHRLEGKRKLAIAAASGDAETEA